MLGEKVVAETLFKEKKSSYAESVPRLFAANRTAHSAALKMNGLNVRDIKVTSL